MATFDRKAAKKKLLKRTEEQNQRKDAGQFGTIFKRTDLPIFSVENGKHKIDIIPYLAGKNDPQIEKGEPTYLLDIWVHRSIGPGGDPYVCLAKTYKRDCPICEYRKEYEGELSEEQMDNLKPRRRTIYNVVERTTEETRKKGVQVWDVAHFFMEKNILPQAENPDTGGVLAFSDPEDGYTIFFKKSGSKDTTKYEGHKLLPRDYKISDKILDQAYTLDSLIHVPTEEELEKAIKGLKKKSSKKDEDEDEMEDDDEEETTTKRKKGKAKDVDDDEDEDVPDELGDDDDDEEEKPKKKKGAKKSSDDEDDDEDEKPKKKSKKGKCPEGGTFGKDFDKFDGCVDCGNFDECSDENDELGADSSDDDDDEEETPKKKGKKKPVDDDDEDEDEKPKKKKKASKDDDDDDEEEETPKKKTSKFNRRTGR
jgi:hypothetical protein